VTQLAKEFKKEKFTDTENQNNPPVPSITPVFNLPNIF
jgi:hypothetical protein